MQRIVIGLPVYNGEEFLAEAIESILGQTFGGFELIISDNASTDRTQEICLRYAEQDSRIRYIRQPVNIGAIPNFNFVTQVTQSEYFKWAAHDDVLAPTYLERCVAVLDANPSVVVAAPGTLLIDDVGAPLRYSAERNESIDRGGIAWPAVPEPNGDLASPDVAARFEAVVLHTNLCVEVFGLIRRSALDRCLPQGAYLGSDKALIAKLSFLGRFWLGTEPLFYRRCHSGQFSAKIMRKTSGASRAEWFVGRSTRTFSHNIYLEKLVLLAEYFRMMAASDLTMRERLACLRPVMQRAASRKVWTTLTAPLLLRHQ